MKTYITFKGTPAEQEAQALTRCEEYLDKRFCLVLQALRNAWGIQNIRNAQRYRSCWLVLSFVGIEGYYPVRGMIRRALK